MALQHPLLTLLPGDVGDGSGQCVFVCPWALTCWHSEIPSPEVKDVSGLVSSCHQAFKQHSCVFIKI